MYASAVFGLLNSKSNHFVFVLNAPKFVDSVKFAEAVYKISCRTTNHAVTNILITIYIAASCQLLIIPWLRMVTWLFQNYFRSLGPIAAHVYNFPRCSTSLNAETIQKSFQCFISHVTSV